MEYNIDILVAGCNTTCMHCYVNGGYGETMQLEDFRYCMDKLKPVFERFGESVTFTLDNEVYNHPQALELLQVVEERAKAHYYHHGSTTGIAILNHPQREEIFQLLKENNWNEVSFAIHGGEQTHNEMVNNPVGMESILKAAKLFKENGAKIGISLMFSKRLVAELDEVDRILNQIPYDYILPVVVDYYPTMRLMKYQEIRCNATEYDQLIAFLKKHNVDCTFVKKCVAEYNEEYVFANIDAEQVRKELYSNETAFFHVDHKLDFYIGNTGIPLKKCGNLRECTADEVISWIESAGDNYYETATIHYDTLLVAVEEGNLARNKENYVYPNMISTTIAMLRNAE